MNSRQNQQKAHKAADVARIAGVPLRTIIMWADAGVIRPLSGKVHEGTGNHRCFSDDEVAIARMVAVPYLRLAIRIGGLLEIAEAIRPVLREVTMRKSATLAWDDTGITVTAGFDLCAADDGRAAMYFGSGCIA